MRRRLIYIFCLMSWFLLKPGNIKASFQQAPIKITGTVKDETGEILPGVSIKEKGTNNGTVTNTKGQFTLTVNAKSILVFTSIGFVSREVPIASDRSLTITLQSESTGLQDVVVVGYGTQKKESVVGAIATVSGGDLLKTGGVSSISEALQGSMPGITAVNSSGRPGADAADIFIRGRSSWQYSAPLTLVDGVERDINQVDQNEIETISVLKDASATAVYGVRGANGVILITTKRGKDGKTTFNFSANLGLKLPTAKPEYADYITAQQMYNEAAVNSQLWGNIIPESVVSAWQQNIGAAGPYNQYFPNVDWWDEMVGKGTQEAYNINARGGVKSMKYFVSLGYLNDGDIYKTEKNDQFDPEFKFQRYNWRSNFDFDITKSTLLSINFSGNFRYKNQAGFRLDGSNDDGGFGQDAFFSRVFKAPRNIFPIRYADGAYGDSDSGEYNVLMNLNEGGQRIYKYYQGFYDAILDQKLDFITPGLSFKGRISYTSYSNYESSILRSGVGAGFAAINTLRYFRTYDLTNPITNSDGTVSYPMTLQKRFPTEDAQFGPVSASYDNFDAYGRRLYYEFSGKYQRKFGKHDVSGLVLMNRQIEVNTGGGIVPYTFHRQDFVGRTTYSYEGRYLAELNAAYSGTEKFAPDKRYGLFPSYSVGWIVSEEPLVKKLLGNQEVLNMLKFRYSRGEVGSDAAAARFNYVALYSAGGGNIRLGTTSATTYGPLYQEGSIANPDATWETSVKQNFGIDFSLFSKLKGNIDFFKENRSGILMQLVTPVAWLGNTVYPTNIGRTKNHGMEVELNYNDRIGDNFRYALKAGFSISENRIVFRDDPSGRSEYQRNRGKPIDWQPRLVNNGYYNSLDDIFNYAGTSYIPQNQLIPGDLMYVDFNSDGRVDGQDQVAMENTTIPASTYSFTLALSYKNWDFNALLYGVNDVSREMPGLLLWDFNDGFVSAQQDVTGRWTPQNAANATKPALKLQNNAQSTAPSTYTYVNATYIRLKNAEISYRFKPQLIKKIGINNIQVYLNGSNLLTFTNLDSRIDPETAGTTVYPIVKRYNLGCRVSF